jgi:hypothetical protein
MSAGVGLRMRSITKLLLSLLLCCVSSLAVAQSNEDVIASLWTLAPNAPTSTSELACKSSDVAGSTFDHVTYRGTAPARAGDCYWKRTVDNLVFLRNSVAETCPSGYNSNTAAGHMHCDRPTTCAAKAGQSKTMNFTVGWARSNRPNAADVVVNLGFPAGSQCDGACVVNMGGVGQGWRSQVPASNGLHRLSADMAVTYTGAACQGGPSPTNDPNSPPPPCPGFTGSINGKPVCVGTPASPLPQSPRPPGLPPEGAGNPTSGDKPSSGVGSGSDGPGRTPTTGNGGNAGGGSNAAIPGGGSEGNGQGDGTPVGTNPDGSTSGEDTPAKDPCGLPGEPACKLDETGTPDGSGVSAAAANAKAKGDALLVGVSGVSQPSSLGWGFGVVLPAASCAPLKMWKPHGEWSIDVCSNGLVSFLRDLIAWAFAVLSCVYIYRSVTGTLASKG